MNKHHLPEGPMRDFPAGTAFWNEAVNGWIRRVDRCRNGRTQRAFDKVAWHEEYSR